MPIAYLEMILLQPAFFDTFERRDEAALHTYLKATIAGCAAAR